VAAIAGDGHYGATGMSRNVLRCHSCKRPLLLIWKQGRTKMVEGARTEQGERRTILLCQCGSKREYEERLRAA
jgi:hypothetical protein